MGREFWTQAATENSFPCGEGRAAASPLDSCARQGTDGQELLWLGRFFALPEKPAALTMTTARQGTRTGLRSRILEQLTELFPFAHGGGVARLQPVQFLRLALGLIGADKILQG